VKPFEDLVQGAVDEAAAEIKHGPDCRLCLSQQNLLAVPLGWSPAAGHGVYTFNSIPQPMVKCPKATKDWQWGTRYFKESWNRMGCVANLKPAY